MNKSKLHLIVLMFVVIGLPGCSFLPSITLHGRVIDQYNQPVKNAHIRQFGDSTFLSSGSGRGHTRTDEQGFFEVNAKGMRLVIGAVTLPGYEFTHQVNSGIERSVSRSRLMHSKTFVNGIDNQRIYSNYHDYSTKDKPYIVQAWRLGKFEGAYSSHLRGWFDAKGKVSTIKFNSLWKRNKVLPGKQEGHLRVTCIRQPMKDNTDVGDWKVTLTPVNGGIQPTNDVFMNLAPESGYLPSIEINMQSGATDYKRALIHQRYYFKSNNGKEYGNLIVDFNPYGKYEDDNVCIVDITSFTLNPNGSRNLELKQNIQ